MFKRRLHRLLRVYTCQNATLLEIPCNGSKYKALRFTVMEEILYLKFFFISKDQCRICSGKIN